MNAFTFKLVPVLTALLLGPSVFAGSHVRYLCQLNLGTALDPQLTNEIIVVQSVDPNPLPVDKFRIRFSARTLEMNFRMTRYKNVSFEGTTNPYEVLDNLSRDQIVGEPFETNRPVRSNGGDVPIYHKTEDGKQAQFIIKSAMLGFVTYDIFPKGEYFLAESTERFVCHEADFFEAHVPEESYNEDQSETHASY